MTLKKNRSIERGVNLLRIMAGSGPMSLAELHTVSGMSKSTLRRILHTLVESGVVRQSLADSKYRLNLYWASSKDKTYLPDVPLYVDIAIARLTTLTKELGWTCGIHMLTRNKMQILDHTRAHSLFYTYQEPADFEVNLFGSSTGIACLAELDDAEIIQRASELPSDSSFSYKRVCPSIEEYLERVNHVRELGYGFRQIMFMQSPMMDDLEAIGLPLRIGDRVFGGIGITFKRRLMSHEEFAEKHLDDLRQALSEIEAEHQKLSG